MTNAPQGQRTIGQLVADATHDVTGLIHSEIALAKAEITSGVAKLGKGAGMFGGAAFVALLGLIFLFETLAFGLIALGVWAWLSFLIVTLLLFLVAAVLALLGRRAVKSAKPVPELAIAEAQQTVAAIHDAR